jgi:hypothetical protein
MRPVGADLFHADRRQIDGRTGRNEIFHSRTVHLDIVKVFIYQLMHKRVALKMLKFSSKQLLHVSVQSPSPGSELLELAKVIVVKIIC